VLVPHGLRQGQLVGTVGQVAAHARPQVGVLGGVWRCGWVVNSSQPACTAVRRAGWSSSAGRRLTARARWPRSRRKASWKATITVRSRWPVASLVIGMLLWVGLPAGRWPCRPRRGRPSRPGPQGARRSHAGGKGRSVRAGKRHPSRWTTGTAVVGPGWEAVRDTVVSGGPPTLAGWTIRPYRRRRSRTPPLGSAA
jgi:hypothetical protein